eukprot:594324-Rhodomonas_salina.3
MMATWKCTPTGNPLIVRRYTRFRLPSWSNSWPICWQIRRRCVRTLWVMLSYFEEWAGEGNQVSTRCSGGISITLRLC